jgi:hypothetical protein
MNTNYELFFHYLSIPVGAARLEPQPLPRWLTLGLGAALGLVVALSLVVG